MSEGSVEEPFEYEGFLPVWQSDGPEDYIGLDEDEVLEEISLEESYRLCGVPGVCQLNANEKCSNISLNSCAECDHVAIGFFIFVALLLGLAIIIGNSIIIKVYYDLKAKRKARKVDFYKTSMAFADLIAGLMIFFVAFPNFAWTINVSFDHITTEVVLLRNTPQSIIGSFFYLLGYTASLYHLLLLGIMRLYAIRWPQRYNQLSSRSSYVGIGVAWSLAIIMATIPNWFPSYYSLEYNPVVFFCVPALNYDYSSSISKFVSAILSLILLLLFPFLLMTVLTITTGIIVRTAIRSSSKTLGSGDSSTTKRNLRQEVSAYKTVAIMQIGFTITLVPIGIAVALFYAGYFHCDNFSNVYLICFYLSRSNSLVNVLVYSFREKAFRSSVKEVFSRKKSFNASYTKPTKTRTTVANSKSNKNTSGVTSV